MRNTLIILVTLVLFASCNSKPEGYTINGTLTGEIADGVEVYLKKSGVKNQLIEVDTAGGGIGTFVVTDLSGPTYTFSTGSLAPGTYT